MAIHLAELTHGLLNYARNDLKKTVKRFTNRRLEELMGSLFSFLKD